MSGNTQSAPLGAMTISAGQVGVFPISFGYYPQEGSRCVSAQYTWASVTGYVEDMSQLAARGIETTIQSCWIDNSTNAQAVTLTILGTEQVVICPANSQGAFPLFFTGTPMLQLTVPATGAGVTRVYYLNVPCPGGVFSTGGSSNLGTYTANPIELLNAGQQAPLLDAYGSLLANTEGSAPTFSCATEITPAAAATDIFMIGGSGSKTLRIHQLRLSFTATAAIGSMAVTFSQRSQFSSGTFTTPATVPHNPAISASASLRQYAVVATPGTAIGNVERFFVGAATLAINPISFNYGGEVGDQALVARVSTTDCYAVSLEGASLPAGLIVRLKIKWTEV